LNLSDDRGQLVNVFGVGSHRLSALLAIEPMKNAKETMAKGIDISASGDHAVNDAERRITPQSVETCLSVIEPPPQDRAGCNQSATSKHQCEGRC
jgi:hypothetical protein